MTTVAHMNHDQDYPAGYLATILKEVKSIAVVGASSSAGVCPRRSSAPTASRKRSALIRLIAPKTTPMSKTGHSGYVH